MGHNPSEIIESFASSGSGQVFMVPVGQQEVGVAPEATSDSSALSWAALKDWVT
jgi:hypothetical protein